MKTNKRWLVALALAFFVTCSVSCLEPSGLLESTQASLQNGANSVGETDSTSGGGGSNNQTPPKEEDKEQGNAAKWVSPLRLPDCVQPAADIEKFVAQAQDKFSAQRDGIVVSPYYTVSAQMESIPVYAVPAFNGETQNIASFDVSEEAFPLRVRVHTTQPVSSAEILPLHYGVSCALEGGMVEFTVNSYGYFTLQLNGSYQNILTISVREKEEIVISEGGKVIEYEQGIHYVDYIDIPSDTTLYLHSGAYLIANPPKADEMPVSAENSSGETTWRPFIQAKNANNVRIVGRGVLDMSALYWGARNPIDFNGCNNVVIDGVTIVNTANWNITVANCREVVVEDVILLSTRRNSDGIAIVDCSNARVSDCFARSGDDLFEVKSMYANGKVPCENVLFERCIAWSDSCRCFGVIHETSKDITGVTFENCDVLYSTPTWSEDLGSLVVINGIRGHVSDVIFRNIEIYNEYGYIMNVATGPNMWSESAEIGKVTNVRFENINVIKGNQVRIKAPQTSTSYIDGVIYKNITLSGRKIASLEELQIAKIGSIGEVRYEKDY